MAELVGYRSARRLNIWLTLKGLKSEVLLAIFLNTPLELTLSEESDEIQFDVPGALRE